jgi:signal peptidase I
MACAAVALAGASWLWPVAAGGQTAFVATHGISMEPRFHKGDLAVLHATDRYRVGDVVAYHSAQLKTVVMHRIVARQGSGFVFKGDNNSFLDPDHPVQAQLIGKLALRIPQGGLWVHRLTGPSVTAGIVFLLLITAGGSAARKRPNRRRRAAMSRHAAPTRRPTRTLGALSPRVRAIATVTACTGVVALAVGALAWRTPVTYAGTVERAGSRSVTFSYSAAVPRSAAYAGPFAVSPDPIFRKLTKVVDLRVTYQGLPGSMSLSGELTAASGWHATIPLAPAVRFNTTRHTTTVRLDLDALDARAAAAATATGVPTDQLTLRLVPEVQSGEAGLFAPAFALSLTPRQLTVVGGPNSLTVTEPTTTTTLQNRPRLMGLAGRTASVAVLRQLSAAGLFMSLLGLLAVVLLTRRSPRHDEAARIRLRYADLLVPVLPMPTSAGRSVADVADVATLAKIAGRYGLLIMTWTRSGVATYIVQDETTTFRFRTGGAPSTAAVDGAQPPPRDPVTEAHGSGSVPAASPCISVARHR